MTGRARRRLGHDPIEIHPSGRPVKGAGVEAVVALALVVAWILIVGTVFAIMGQNPRAAGLWPSMTLGSLFCFCWAGAEYAVGVKRLIWPGSAFGILGPLSLGFAVADLTPELRDADLLARLSIVSLISAFAMIAFLLRFKLPGLVSPIITFSLLGLFLELYGADVNRLREVEGFSPRGIIAALLREPWLMAAFSVLSVAAAVYARRLDMKGGNFGLAAARPLHLIGGGVAVLIAGRVLGWLPNPLNIGTLSLLWIAAHLWGLRVNRVGVQIAMHFAMVKPLVHAVIDPMGLTMTIQDWSWLLTGLLIFDLALWPIGHKWSRSLNWTLGPGGKRPPLDRPGWKWRYWPYALEDSPRHPKDWT